MDCGLIRKKPGVSLEKGPGRTITHDPRPLDLDPVVQICSDRVLILGVGLRSGGQGGLRATAAAERAGALCSAAARHGLSGVRS